MTTGGREVSPVHAGMDGTEGDGATSRLEALFSREGLRRLRDSTVVVLGLGGVGSNCVEALARGGVGRLVLVDSDMVQASNINRQAIAYVSTVGRRKVDVMRDMVLDINLDALVETHDMRVLPENLDSLMRPYVGTATYVVDALDTIATKLVLARFAQDEGMPLVSAMGAAGKVHPEMLRFSDIYDTAVCPLCHAVRKRARKQGIERLCVLYSRERPLASRSGEPGTREALGTASFMPPIMGQMLAGFVIRRIVGMPDMGVEAR